MQLFDDNAFIPTSAKLLTNWMQIYAVSRGKDDLDAIKSEYPECNIFFCSVVVLIANKADLVMLIYCS